MKYRYYKFSFSESSSGVLPASLGVRDCVLIQDVPYRVVERGVMLSPLTANNVQPIRLAVCNLLNNVNQFIDLPSTDLVDKLTLIIASVSQILNPLRLVKSN